MAIKTDAIGKTFPATSYEVGAEKIREYAYATGADGPVHLDREAAKAAGFRDLVAPPMFAVVYKFPAMAIAAIDPELKMNLMALVHGGQEFEWREPVCAGDRITTHVECKEIYERDGKGFYVFETNSRNDSGELTARGLWTNIVRGV